MGYQVFARKWRPRSLREMVGQTHVLKVLINALDNRRLHHAYLFTGTHGVGKTTIARIPAKCLNCKTGVSSTPCGECSVCREIDEDRFVDLIEVDVTGRTKVGDTRELLDNVQYSPTRGRHKVYLIDEVHTLLLHSFDALLKTFEEPPPHVRLLLAITDPQKLPVTILSRCLRFSLRNIPPERVVEHLTHVLGAENVSFGDDALWSLGCAADGSMRDVTGLTDQAIVFGEDKALVADVQVMLGTLDHGQVYGMLQALLEGDVRALLGAVRHLVEQGPDWGGVLVEILNVLHRVTIAQALPEAIDNSQGDHKWVLALAQMLSAEDVWFCYQMGLIDHHDLPLAPNPRSGFEMVLLWMLASRPANADGAPRAPLKDPGISKAATDPADSPVAGAASSTPVIVVAAAPVVAAPVKALVALPVASSAPPAVVEIYVAEAVVEEPAATAEVVDLPWEESTPSLAAESEPEPEPELESEPESEPEPLVMEASPVPPAVAVRAVVETVLEALLAALPVAPDEQDEQDDEPLPVDDYYEVDMDILAYLDVTPELDVVVVEEPLPAAKPATGLAAEWLELFPWLGLGSPTASTTANCTLVAADGDHWHLHLDPGQSALFNATQQRRLNDTLNQHLGCTLKLEVTLQKPEQEAPAQTVARRRVERQRTAEASIDTDPLARQSREQFAAVVHDGIIEPLETKAWPALGIRNKTTLGVKNMMKGGMAGLMKQAQQMQEKMQRMQEEPTNAEATGQSGVGLVSVVMTGHHDVKCVSLDDSLMQEDKEILEDLIAAVVNNAVRRIEQNNQEKMFGLTSGM